MDPLRPFDSNMQLLSKVLDLRAEKAQVISSNIANAETPGYSPSRFAFEEDLAHAIGRSNTLSLATSNEVHISLGPANFNSISGKTRTVEDQSGLGRHVPRSGIAARRRHAAPGLFPVQVGPACCGWV